MSRLSPLQRSDPELYGAFLRLEPGVGRAIGPLVALAAFACATIILGGPALRALSHEFAAAAIAGASVLATSLSFAWSWNRGRRTGRLAEQRLSADLLARDRVLGRIAGDRALSQVVTAIAWRARHEPIPPLAAPAAGGGSFRCRAPEWIGVMLRRDQLLHSPPAMVIALVASLVAMCIGAMLVPGERATRDGLILAGPGIAGLLSSGLLAALRDRIVGRRVRREVDAALAAAGLPAAEVARELAALGLAVALRRRLGFPARRGSTARRRPRRRQSRSAGGETGTAPRP